MAVIDVSEDNVVNLTGLEVSVGAGALGVPEIRVRRRWTKLESVQVSNFKAVADATIPLGDVTILVGANRSGKSSALQAIHWAARAATYITPKNTKETIAYDRIDYLPSSEPLRAAHNGELKSETRTAPVSVTFNHAVPEGSDPVQVKVKIWAARNKGGIAAHIEGGTAVSQFKQRQTFVTAYIPGLAGLSERETVLAQPQLRRQAASGDAGSVLRNVLFNLATDRASEPEGSGAARLERLNELVSEIHPNTTLRVQFDDREDINISATIEDSSSPASRRSLESAATGVLQIVQLFAYLILFRPKVMLIDEPDAHLHPDKQERLIETIERATSEFDVQIILTTHSPHVVRAATPNAKLVWMAEGQVKSDDDDTIRSLLGWGGLDKKVLFFVEDEDDKAVRSILRQWPQLARSLNVCRTFGIENLPRKKLLGDLLGDGSLNLKAIVHRDRDFMTSADIPRWEKLYEHDRIHCWVTAGCDVESYFCDPAYLAQLYEVSESEAQTWVAAATNTITGAKDTFLNKRKVIIRTLYELGGGDDAEVLWSHTGRTPQTVLGKLLWKALKPVIKAAGYDDNKLDRYEMVPSFEMAPDLKTVVEKALAS